MCIIDSVDSIFTGFAIFSIVGFMAHDLQKSVPDVVRSGLYLAFVAYPEALSMMPGGVAWSVLFFIMMVVIGVDSQVLLTN